LDEGGREEEEDEVEDEVDVEGGESVKAIE